MEKSARALSAGEYFQRTMHIDYYLNGSVRAIDETRKIQTFNATLSLCDHYPLSLREQVSPIVDLMALNNSHFKKLKEFITLQLPSGFPLKIGAFCFFCQIKLSTFLVQHVVLFVLINKNKSNRQRRDTAVSCHHGQSHVRQHTRPRDQCGSSNDHQVQECGQESFVERGRRRRRVDERVVGEVRRQRQRQLPGRRQQSEQRQP